PPPPRRSSPQPASSSPSSPPPPPFNETSPDHQRLRQGVRAAPAEPAHRTTRSGPVMQPPGPASLLKAKVSFDLPLTTPLNGNGCGCSAPCSVSPRRAASSLGTPR